MIRNIIYKWLFKDKIKEQDEKIRILFDIIEQLKNKR